MSKVSLFVYKVECENIGFSKDPLLTETSNYAILFGQELNSEVSTSGLLFGWCASLKAILCSLLTEISRLC